MWFHRIIAWVKALVSAPALDDTTEGYTGHEGCEPRRASLDAYAPTYEPEFTRRQLLYPRDQLRTFGLSAPQDTYPLDPPLLDPPLYESPKTIPLIRLSPQVDLRYDEPTQPLHVVSEPPAPLASREPTQPAPSEPLAANLQRLSELPDALESFEHLDELDDLTRRLLFLRRLVRQRVYNEGFAVEETPQQYRHSLGLSDEHGASDSQN